MSSESRSRASARARWIAAGFLGAFAASVVTVIYTGLMVEGRPSEFDAGFRSVSLATGELAEIELIFSLADAVSAARLELSLPAMLERVDGGGDARLSLAPGRNALPITVRATGAGSGYLIARIVADEPVALERVFVTVSED